MENCIEPKCNFSLYRNKCTKPNSYIEAIAWCKRNNKHHGECRVNYNNNKQREKEIACDRYYERLNIQKKPRCIDPKCHFSKLRNKCVKPNPYIEKVAYCGRIKTKRPECEGDYKGDKKEAILNACKRYDERQLFNSSKLMKKGKKDKKVPKEPKVKIPKEPKVKIPKEPKVKIPKKPKVKTPEKSKSKSLEPKVSPKKSSSMTPSRVLRIKDFMKKRAAKIIQRLTMPFINRVSANINYRIKFASLLNKYIGNIDDIQCLKNIGVNQYSIGDGKIKLMKQIGTKSIAGVIYMSKGTNEGELYRFAVKIMKNNPQNKREIDLLELVTRQVLTNSNPHFPIMYKNFICNSKIASKNSDFPEVTNNANYFINLNEIATGDLKMFMSKTKTNAEHIYTSNALAQIFMAILSFHSLGLYHNDCHYGNFLYHRVNPGGYYKYQLFDDEVYIENLGYLWVIWDFGYATKDTDSTYKNQNNYYYLEDYFRIIYAFANNSDTLKGWIEDKYPVPSETKNLAVKIFQCRNTLITQNLTKIRKGEESLFNMLKGFKLFKRLEDLPSDAKIINQDSFKTSKI